jgi:hypothetical protein
MFYSSVIAAMAVHGALCRTTQASQHMFHLYNNVCILMRQAQNNDGMALGLRRICSFRACCATNNARHNSLGSRRGNAQQTTSGKITFNMLFCMSVLAWLFFCSVNKQRHSTDGGGDASDSRQCAAHKRNAVRAERNAVLWRRAVCPCSTVRHKTCRGWWSSDVDVSWQVIVIMMDGGRILAPGMVVIVVERTGSVVRI